MAAANDRFDSRVKSPTRRELLAAGAALGAAGILGGVADPAGARRRAARRGRRTVAILGGGVAGLTAAHELAERGFQVSVYERRAFGGKARSFGVPGTARGGRLPLPAEHGARFIPGIYQNLPDTMRRIPFGSNPNGTFDNLATASADCYARSGGREDWNISYAPGDTQGWTLEQLRETVAAPLSSEP